MAPRFDLAMYKKLFDMQSGTTGGVAAYNTFAQSIGADSAEALSSSTQYPSYAGMLASSKKSIGESQIKVYNLLRTNFGLTDEQLAPFALNIKAAQGTVDNNYTSSFFDSIGKFIKPFNDEAIKKKAEEQVAENRAASEEAFLNNVGKRVNQEVGDVFKKYNQGAPQ